MQSEKRNESKTGCKAGKKDKTRQKGKAQIMGLFDIFKRETIDYSDLSSGYIPGILTTAITKAGSNPPSTLPLPAGYETETTPTGGLTGGITVTNTPTPTVQKSFTVLSDWKNHQVYKGDLYQIVFDVNSTVAAVLNGISVAVDSDFLRWTSQYTFNAKAWTTAFVNRILNYSSTIGLLRDHISVIDSATFLTSDKKTFLITFSITENSWPLGVIVAVIGAIMLIAYLTVREVRIMKSPGDVPGLSGLVTEGKGLLLMVIVVFAMYYTIIKKS